MSKLTPARIEKALKYRYRKFRTKLSAGTTASTKFESPTALREFALSTNNTGTHFNYEVKLPKNFQIPSSDLQIGQLVAFEIKQSQSTLDVSATFSATINEGYFAAAVARMLAPALNLDGAWSLDYRATTDRATTSRRVILGEIAETDAAEMEAAHTQIVLNAPADFNPALFNPIGLRLKKKLSEPKIAEIQISSDFKLNGQSKKIDEHLIAELRNYVGANVTFEDGAAAHLLTGLAATGLVLSVSGTVPSDVVKELTKLVKKPLPAVEPNPTVWLEWLWRSEAQRRLALLHHSGWFNGEGSFPSVDVLLVTNRIGMVPAALKFVDSQNYPNLNIKLGLHNITKTEAKKALADLQISRNLEVHHFAKDQNLGEIYGALTEISTADYIAKFDDDDMYGKNHLLDAIISMKYSGAGLFGRTPNLTWLATTEELLLRPFGDEEIFHKYIIGPTMVINRQALKRVGGWRPTPWAVDKALIDRFQTLGGGIYRAGAFGWAYVRHDQGHTWLRDESHFRNQAEHVWTGREAKALLKKVIS